MTEFNSNREQAEAQLAGFATLAAEQDETRFEQRIDDERDSILSIDVERTVVVVLCTGGPHVEIRWTEDRTPMVHAFGWFGADEFSRELTDDEQAGLEVVLGDFDDIAEVVDAR